jgi:hypothetical protein
VREPNRLILNQQNLIDIDLEIGLLLYYKKMKKTETIILLGDNNKLGEKFKIMKLKRGFVVNYLLPRQEAILYNHNNFS